jgi:hypothetical protein
MLPQVNIMKYIPVEPHLSIPKKLFLGGSLGDISFMIYDHSVNRFAFFQHYISHALEEETPVVYAYYSTNLITSFKKEIAEKKIILYELRKGINGLKTLVDGFYKPEACKTGRIHVVFDFSHQCDLHLIIEFLRAIKNIKESPVSVSGIVAFDLHIISDENMQEISAIIPSVIFISNTSNLIAFPAVLKGSGIAGIVSQDIVDSVVKHSLEQLILMNLQQPVSGFDILKAISDRFHVEIPLARVYSYLYDLENKRLVTTMTRGRAKIYVPTEEGRMYIKTRLHDLQAAHEFILGYRR